VNEVRLVGHYSAGPGFSHVEVAAAEPEKVTLEIASSNAKTLNLEEAGPYSKIVCDGLVGTRTIQSKEREGL
jgi:hypothetical protein